MKDEFIVTEALSCLLALVENDRLERSDLDAHIPRIIEICNKFLKGNDERGFIKSHVFLVIEITNVIKQRNKFIKSS